MVIDSAVDLFGMFYENPSSKLHTPDCSARVIGSFQFLAALLNSAGSQLGYGTATLTNQQMTDMYLALKNGPRSTILSLASALDTFNKSGDSIAFASGVDQGSATPQTSQRIAVSPIGRNC